MLDPKLKPFLDGLAEVLADQLMREAEQVEQSAQPTEEDKQTTTTL